MINVNSIQNYYSFIHVEYIVISNNNQQEFVYYYTMSRT